MLAWKAWAIALSVLVPLSGCTTPDDARPDAAAPSPHTPVPFPGVQWEPHACDARGDAGISQNAPWIAAWQGDVDTVMDRFAQAIGHALPPDRRGPDENGWLEWPGDGFAFRYRPDVEYENFHLPVLEYVTPTPWPTGSEDDRRADMQLVLFRFGIADEVELEFVLVPHATSVKQKYQGQTLYTTWSSAGYGGRSEGGSHIFGLHPFYDLTDADMAVSAEEAKQLALAYHTCVMEQEGRTEEEGYVLQETHAFGQEVRNRSLVHRVTLVYSDPPPHHHCGFTRAVQVDAETGAIHGHHIPLCS